jgi:hypothetical protein
MQLPADTFPIESTELESTLCGPVIEAAESTDTSIARPAISPIVWKPCYRV